MEAGAKTISVPEAGRIYFGIEANASYRAAARGEIPVIRVGRLKRVPIAAMEKLLEQAGEPASVAPPAKAPWLRVAK